MEKGNIVTSNEHGSEGLVLAVRKDGTAAKIYVLGSDGKEVWKQTDSITVVINGDEQCWKCGGSGMFYGGGIVENGVYKGYSGKCYGCQGRGKQNNADRVRNHYYWHREKAIWAALDAIERGETPEPLPHPPTGRTALPVDAPVKAAKPTIKSKRKNHPDPDRKAGKPEAAKTDDGSLIDCKGCGCLHRDDTMCAW
jgi:hypothetical protein